MRSLIKDKESIWDRKEQLRVKKYLEAVITGFRLIQLIGKED